MNYLKLLQNLKADFKKANRERYLNMNIVFRFIFTIIFIPLRVSFFFSKLIYWFIWFFFKAFTAPVDYLANWFESQKAGLGDISKAILVWVCVPFIFFQQVILALNAFSFFFQWFGLMLVSYIMTLGAVKWQPVISNAVFPEEEPAPAEEDDDI